jgi:hypothetical protein
MGHTEMTSKHTLNNVMNTYEHIACNCLVTKQSCILPGLPKWWMIETVGAKRVTLALCSS